MSMSPKQTWLVILTLIIVGAALVILNPSNKNGSQTASQTNQNQQMNINPFITPKNMKVTSADFQSNGPIPVKFTCEGSSISPELNISAVPINARSLALTLHDPDAPLAGGFTHWVMFNIDPRTIEIPQNNPPKSAVQATNGAGKIGYIGPCPPSGTHHYHFMVYALDSVLVLDKTATKQTLEQAMAGHVIDDAELIGTYKSIKN